MKAIIKESEGMKGVRLKKIEEPKVNPKEIKVKIHAAGICGTDLHIIHDEYPCDSPVVLGHEYSGVIVETGDEVKKFNVGDRIVSLTAKKTCKNCRYCKQGLLMLCEDRKSIGSGLDGAFTEYMVIPEDIAYHIPDNVSLDEATLTEPLACVVRCIIERGSINSGDLVMVSGPGTIGMLSLQVSKACGGEVVVLGTNNDLERLEFAKELGAKEVINIEAPDAFEKLSAITKADGFDVAIECAGVGASLNLSIDMLKKQGNLIQVGLFGKSIVFDSDKLLMKEINYSNGFATEPTSWEIALKLLEYEKVNLKPLISNKVKIDDWKKAIGLAESRKGYKTLITPV